jgi:hypothetical protein
MPSQNNVTLAVAQALAAQGLHVFPCKPRNKEPTTGHGFKDATVDPATIERWWTAAPENNLAVACGAVSNVFVLDIDGSDGEFELRKLEAAHGTLPPTVESITAKGRHIFFRHPGRPITSTVRKFCGVDIRADGSYVVVPPSIHPSGRPYQWSVDCAKVIAPAPDWLIAIVCAPASRANGKVTADWHLTDIPEGQRDNTLTRICGYMLRRYVDPRLVLDLIHLINDTRCRPPLPDDDVDRICNSIANKEHARRNGHDR